MSIHAQVSAARQRLRDAGMSPTSRSRRTSAGAARAGLTAERFLTDAREPVPEGFTPHYESLVARRAAREPFAYIVGVREFWGLELEVTPDVLIPRPATGLMSGGRSRSCSRIESVPLAIADVCTGCGCVAVALAHERPTSTVRGSDISPAALVVARRNAPGTASAIA